MDVPLITIEELTDLRARLVRAEARVKELEARPAAPPASLNPFMDPSPVVAEVPRAQAFPAPALVASAAPIVVVPGSPPGPVSIMPFDGAKRRKRLVTVVVSLLLLVVTAIVAVTIVSRTMH